MSLPFSQDQFLDIFGAYNRAVWPAAIVLWVATAAAMVRWYQGRPDASRVLLILLAFHWAWAGAVYHFGFFSRINPAAWLFGAAFLLEGALLLRHGIASPVAAPAHRQSVRGVAGLGLVAYALVYPALGLLFGLSYPRLPTFGVPCPTTILTAGVLLLLPRRATRALGVIPVLWAGIGGSAAFALGIRGDVGLVFAGLLLLIDGLRGVIRGGGPAPAVIPRV